MWFLVLNPTYIHKLYLIFHIFYILQQELLIILVEINNKPKKLNQVIKEQVSSDDEVSCDDDEPEQVSSDEEVSFDDDEPEDQ